MSEKEGTLRMMASGRWAVYRPGRLRVEITSGELFRVEVDGELKLTRMEYDEGYYSIDGYPLRDGLRAAIGEHGQKFRRCSRLFSKRRASRAAATLSLSTSATKVPYHIVLLSLSATLLPPHSITSSARTMMEGGMVMPSALAVFRLIISSIFMSCCTGSSDGFSPLRIFPT